MGPPNASVGVDIQGTVWVVSLRRPEKRNAVDRPTAAALADAFRAFEDDDDARVAVLEGGDHFCAGADLHAIAAGSETSNRLQPDGDAPMGPTRMRLSKPVIAAIEGHAVAGGLELALWCDLRVAASTAILGVFCRRWGVPLIDGGTARLPRLIGLSRAMDLVLTGRPVPAGEAHDMGLVNRVVPHGMALEEALALARQLAGFPQSCLRADRAAVHSAFDGTFDDAMAREFAGGIPVIDEAREHAHRFSVGGAGRHGRFDSVD